MSIPKPPEGWKIYKGKHDWNLIPGAKYWDKARHEWAQVEASIRSVGAHAIERDTIIVPAKKRSFTAYCVTQIDSPTLACINYKRHKTLARVREIWGKDYRKNNPKLRIVKVIVTEA